MSLWCFEPDSMVVYWGRSNIRSSEMIWHLPLLVRIMNFYESADVLLIFFWFGHSILWLLFDLVLMTKLCRCSLVSPKLVMNRKKAVIWREVGRLGILNLYPERMTSVVMNSANTSECWLLCAKLWGWKMCSEDLAPVMVDIAV